MLQKLRIVQNASKAIGRAIDDVVKQLNDDLIEQEPAFTERLVQSVQTAVNSLSNGALVWEGKTLTDRGSRAQEPIYGADILVTLHVNLPKLKVSKGFLAQAKLLKPGRKVNRKEINSQCEKMLQLTPASYVFLYSKDGVRVVPAISVVTSTVSFKELYSRSAQNFFEEHFECFIGDRSISTPNIRELEKLREKFEARNVLAISLSEKPK